MPHVPPVHLIIRLPYDRAEASVNDPPPIEWNADKENMLWEVIARSRAADSGGTDWQGLSAHLQVPLPYLLYRAQVRYEEDLRGLQDIRGSLGATNSSSARPSEVTRLDERPSSASTLPTRDTSRLASPVHRRTPVTSHQHSGSHPNIPGRMLRLHGSSSTLTLPNRRATPNEPSPRPTSPASSESSTSSGGADKAEEEERRQEEQDAVGIRLKQLEKMMSSDMLGFARPPRIKSTAGPSTLGPRSPLRETTRRDSTSESASVSPQGSIPSIPSPPPEARSPESSQALSSAQATTAPTSPSPHSPRGRRQHQQRLGIPAHALHSQRGSSHGSTASSFSDISDVSASALESALLSNIRGGGSRLSMFAQARSHFGGRAGSSGQ